MTNEQKEGTRIIAEFMGGIAKNNNYGISGYMFDDFNKPDFSHWVLVDMAKYHTSFDWLRPVYYNIRTYYYNTYTGSKEDKEMKELFNSICTALMHGGIEDLFNEIVKFLTWLKQKQAITEIMNDDAKDGI